MVQEAKVFRSCTVSGSDGVEASAAGHDGHFYVSRTMNGTIRYDGFCAMLVSLYSIDKIRISISSMLPQT